jgi:hypothetical protein
MRKSSFIQRDMLTLPGLWVLLAAFLISGVGLFLGGETASAHPQGECVGEDRKPSFGSAVVVNSGEVVCGSLTSFGGTMVVQGEVRGDIVSFDSNVLVGGRVDGNLTLYGGNLTLQNSAHIKGDIHVCGGQWIEGSASRLQGSVFDCTQSLKWLITGDGGFSFRFWYVVIWVGLAMILTTFLPEHVMLVRTTAQQKKRRSLLLGLLSLLLAPIVLAILVALILPIPLAILIAIGLLAAWTLGVVSVGWLIGEYLMRTLLPKWNARPLQIMVGSAVLALAGSLPYVGWIISIGAGLLGLGAVFLSRFGTRLYSPPRQPLPLESQP